METTDMISGRSEPNWAVADAGTAFVKWYVMRLARGLNKGWSSGSSKAEVGFRDAAVLVIRSAGIVVERAVEMGADQWKGGVGMLLKRR